MPLPAALPDTCLNAPKYKLTANLTALLDFSVGATVGRLHLVSIASGTDISEEVKEFSLDAVGDSCSRLLRS